MRPFPHFLGQKTNKQKKIILSLKYEKIDKIWIFMKITDLLGNTDNVVSYFFKK